MATLDNMAHNDHHCPGRKGKEPCRRLKFGKLSFCHVHQIVCILHMFHHMKRQPCAKCRGIKLLTAPEPAPVEVLAEKAPKAKKEKKKNKKWSFAGSWMGKKGKKN